MFYENSYSARTRGELLFLGRNAGGAGCKRGYRTEYAAFYLPYFTCQACVSHKSCAFASKNAICVYYTTRVSFRIVKMLTIQFCGPPGKQGIYRRISACRLPCPSHRFTQGFRLKHWTVELFHLSFQP